MEITIKIKFGDNFQDIKINVPALPRLEGKVFTISAMGFEVTSVEVADKVIVHAELITTDRFEELAGDIIINPNRYSFVDLTFQKILDRVFKCESPLISVYEFAGMKF